MSEPGILVSKEHGVNPSIGVCISCGESTGEILMIGKCNRYICRNCKLEIYDNGTPRKCPSCGSGNISLEELDVEAPRKMPYGLCDKCKAENEKMDALVRQGGIYWRCTGCKSTGVVPPGKPLALAVRRQMQIAAPKPCGVELTPEQCPICSKLIDFFISCRRNNNERQA
jgi:rubrerythrin